MTWDGMATESPGTEDGVGWGGVEWAELGSELELVVGERLGKQRR